MKTTTLILVTALAVGITSCVVPSAYSQGGTNTITVTVPASTFALVGNPLSRGSNTLSEILPDVPRNTTVVYEFAQVGYVSYRRLGSSWALPGSGIVFA